MTTLRTRACVFVAAVGLYLLGVSAAVVTGFPTALAVPGMFVAASTWTFGIRSDLAPMA